MAIPNVVGNIAGLAAQARINRAAEERQIAANREDAKTAFLRNLGTGLLNTGLGAALDFGKAAYGEATEGARAQQRIDLEKQQAADIERQRGFERASALGAMGADQPGYKAPAAPSPSALPEPSPSSPVADVVPAGPPRVAQRLETKTPALLQQFDSAKALDGITDPNARAIQEAVMRRRDAEAAARAAAAEKAQREWAWKIEQDRIASEQGAADAINKTTLHRNRYGVTSAPIQAARAVVDEQTGLTRVEYGPQVAPPGGRGGGSGRGGGGASAPSAGVLAEPVTVIAARPGRRGDPTIGTPTKTWAGRGEWAEAAIKNPTRYAVSAADASKIAAAYRIIKANEADASKADIVRQQVAILDGIRENAARAMGPVFAEVGDTLATSPADIAKEAAKSAAAAEKATAEAGAVDAATQLDIAKLGADTDARLAAAASDGFGPTRSRIAGLTQAQVQAAVSGAAPPPGLSQRSVEEWNRRAAEGERIRKRAADLKKGIVDVGSAKRTVVQPSAAPPVDLSTQEAIVQAWKGGRINRQQAADAFRKLGINFKE